MASIPDLSTCKKLGFIVPSSNFAVEPITTAIIQSLNANIICVYTRIQVKQVGSDSKSTGQFSTETMIEAARLLADAEVDAILWNGTSGMWVGTDLKADQKLAQAMKDATGIPCSTTTIATVSAIGRLRAKKVSLAVPYTASLTEKLVEFFEGCGNEVVKAERLEVTPASNAETARVSVDDMKELVRRAASPDVGALIIACTNLPASGLVDELEKELGVIILDSIVVTAWWALRMIDYKGSVKGWGKLMEDMLKGAY